MSETQPHTTNEALQRQVDLLVVELLREMEKIGQLEQAIEGRDVIGQAKGILMERLKINAEDAFTVLSQTSNRTNTKLHDVALVLARTGTLAQTPWTGSHDRQIPSESS